MLLKILICSSCVLSFNKKLGAVGRGYTEGQEMDMDPEDLNDVNLNELPNVNSLEPASDFEMPIEGGNSIQQSQSNASKNLQSPLNQNSVNPEDTQTTLYNDANNSSNKNERYNYSSFDKISYDESDSKKNGFENPLFQKAIQEILSAQQESAKHFNNFDKNNKSNMASTAAPQCVDSNMIQDDHSNESQENLNESFASQEYYGYASNTASAFPENSSSIFPADDLITRFKRKITLHKRGENLVNNIQENKPYHRLAQYKIKLKRYIQRIEQEYQDCIKYDYSNFNTHKDLINKIRIMYSGFCQNFFKYFKHISKEKELYFQLLSLVEQRDLIKYEIPNIPEFLEILRIFTALVVEYKKVVERLANAEQYVQSSLADISAKISEFFNILSVKYTIN